MLGPMMMSAVDPLQPTASRDPNEKVVLTDTVATRKTDVKNSALETSDRPAGMRLIDGRVKIRRSSSGTDFFEKTIHWE
ncbi:hypothetical protein AVEN_68947-1 [Araneus ventricosus]|uniref:Uncharacterized protein n=1 Tax=Araneus ventricosus TaxID=182803 RepID=A0A4Y2HI24_ARAVE|nr:hypothetical protein AVEN_68947-1 [Araneus ventricosus]